MAGVNLFAMAFAVRWTGSIGGGLAYAAVLLLWYAAVARASRLFLWWVAMIPVVLGLLAGAAWLAPRDGRWLALGFVAAGAIISFSPGARTAAATATVRAVRVVSFAVIGWFDEVWASPRLLPYNVLRLMMAAGIGGGSLLAPPARPS